MRGYVERPRKLKIKYLNENAVEKVVVVEDFLATVFQHELDHLNGKLMMEHNLIEGYIDEKSDLNPELFHKLKQKLS